MRSNIRLETSTEYNITISDIRRIMKIPSSNDKLTILINDNVKIIYKESDLV